MPRILSVSTVLPPNEVKQAEAVELTRSLFSRKFKDIERLLNVFQNGDIEKRDVCMPLGWYGQEHDFEERNDLYIRHAIDYGVKAVQACLQQSKTLSDTVDPFRNRCHFLHFQHRHCHTEYRSPHYEQTPFP